MDKGYLAKLIINHYGYLPSKQEIKDYICKYQSDCQFSTIDLSKAVTDVYLNNNYKIKKEVKLEEIQKMYETMTAAEIAKELGIDTKSIQNKLYSNNVKKQKNVAITEEELRKLYPKYPMQIVAEKTGLTYQTIVKYVHMYKIKKPRRKDYIQMWEDKMKEVIN